MTSRPIVFLALLVVAVVAALSVAGCGSTATPDMQDARTVRYDSASAMQALTVCAANAGHYLVNQKPDGPISKKMMRESALRIAPIPDRSNRGIAANAVAADAAPFLYHSFSATAFFELLDLEVDPETSGLQLGRGDRVADRYPADIVLAGAISAAERVTTSSANAILNFGTIVVSLGASRAYSVFRLDTRIVLAHNFGTVVDSAGENGERVRVDSSIVLAVPDEQVSVSPAITRGGDTSLASAVAASGVSSAMVLSMMGDLATAELISKFFGAPRIGRECFKALIHRRDVWWKDDLVAVAPAGFSTPRFTSAEINAAIAYGIRKTRQSLAALDDDPEALAEEPAADRTEPVPGPASLVRQTALAQEPRSLAEPTTTLSAPPAAPAAAPSAAAPFIAPVSAKLNQMLEYEQNGHVDTTKTGNRAVTFQITQTGHIGAVRCRVVTVRQWATDAGRTQLEDTEDRLYCRQAKEIWFERKA